MIVNFNILINFPFVRKFIRNNQTFMNGYVYSPKGSESVSAGGKSLVPRKGKPVKMAHGVKSQLTASQHEAFR